MKFRIIFLPQTKNDRAEIKSFLSKFYKGTYKRFSILLKKKISRLKIFPFSGPVYESNPRYRKLIVGDYLIFYKVYESIKIVEIHYIIHSSRDIASLLD